MLKLAVTQTLSVSRGGLFCIHDMYWKPLKISISSQKLSPPAGGQVGGMVIMIIPCLNSFDFFKGEMIIEIFLDMKERLC